MVRVLQPIQHILAAPKLKDIDTSLLTPSCRPSLPPLIDDPNGHIAVLDAQPCGGGAIHLQHRFDTAGKNLVICTFLPHFEFASMYGWVTVRGGN